MDICQRRLLSLLLIAALLLSLSGNVLASDAGSDPEQALEETASYLLRQEPQYGPVSGAWMIVGLCRSGCAVPAEFITGYYDRLLTQVIESGGVLSDRRYTEYCREVLAVTAMGLDARDVSGYDLTVPLGDKEGVLRQGLSGPVWALIALDSGAYPVPVAPAGKVQGSRPAYVKSILDAQLADGGWAFGNAFSADPDMTAMALQALARYVGAPRVEKAIRRGLTCLSEKQNDRGGFSSYGTENAESCAQVLTALCVLGIDPVSPEFIKNGNTIVDALLSYRVGDGSFRHLPGGQTDQMATEQAYYALSDFNVWK